MRCCLDRTRSPRTHGPIWLLIGIAILLFVALMATGHGAERGEKVVFVGARWCLPCQGAKTFTLPSLRKSGVIVEELDFDKDFARLPAEVLDLPTYFLIRDGLIVETVVGHVHQADILKRLQASRRASAPGPPAAKSPRADALRLAESVAPPPDLVAQLRKFLGTTKPKSHSSLAWTFEESSEITIDHKTKVTRPRQLFGEFDFDGDVLTITFAEPLPQAHVIKAGATISVDIPRVTIRRNLVTATADVAFGLQRDFEFTITKSPFDE